MRDEQSAPVAPVKRAVRGWRVLGWDVTTMMWTVRHWTADHNEAADRAEALEHRGARARIVVAPRWVTVPTPPPAPTAAARFRQAQAAAMVDRFDALKRYKSPG